MKDLEKNPPFPVSPQQIKQMMAAPELQELWKLLQKDGGAALQQAAKQFRAGDSRGAQETLQPFLQDRKAEELLRKLDAKGR